MLLVGGSTRIPRITQLLAERLGQEPHGEVDPDLCVALGAGIQAGIEMGHDMPAVLVDITPYTFGTGALGELNGRPYADTFVPLIRRNAKLPAAHTETFYTVFEDQDSVKIKVYQGEDPDALKNVEIGTFLFEGLNQEQGARDHGILVTYDLDLDGMLNVHAVERATGREIRGVIERAIGGSTEEALSASKERIAARWGAEEEDAEAPAQTDDPQAPPEIRETLQRAESALATAPEEDREEIADLMKDLRDAVKAGDTERAAEGQAGAGRDPVLPGVAGVQHCPTCGARYRGGSRCHRCQTDVGQVLLIERAAAALRTRARLALRDGRGGQARDDAERACALHRCSDSLAVRAVVALRERDHPLALRLWLEYERSKASDSAPER